MNTITIKLSDPITHAGTEYKELSLRAAKTGDFAAADAVTGEFSKTLAVVAGMAGIPYPAAKEISMRDFTALIEQAAPLMGNGNSAAAGPTS
jgi:hypothetical protein